MTTSMFGPLSYNKEEIHHIQIAAMMPMSQADATPDKMDYARAIEYWFGCINYEQRAPLPEDLRLEGMHRLLEALGNPHQNLRIVHVAGSKGKGSVAATLAAILQHAGYQTGLFTSPHLIKPEERFQVDGTAIAPGELAELMEELQSAVAARQLQPTFFEVATALGFLYFQRHRVNIAVLEVSLGRARFYNVCLPEVAIVTILDHMKQLGNTPRASPARRPVLPDGRPSARCRCDHSRDRRDGQTNTPLRALSIDFRFNYERRAGQPCHAEPGNGGRVQITTWLQ